MKKLLAVLLCTFLVLGALASCSDGTEENVILNDEPESEVEAEIPAVEINTFDDLTAAKKEAQKTINSMGTEIEMKIVADALDEELVLDITVDSDIDLINKLTHIVTTVSGMGEETVDETYTDMGETLASYFKSYDGGWFKEKIDESDISIYDEIFDNNAIESFDTSKYITPISFEKTEYDGRECYKAEYTFNLNVEEMLTDMGAEEMLDKYFEEAEVDEESLLILNFVLDDLGSVNVVEYVDSENFYTVYAEIEMKDVLSKIVDKILDVVVSTYGEGVSPEDLGIVVNINEFSVTATMHDYNNVNVIIPEEVLSAPDFEEVENDYALYEEEAFVA